MTSIFSMKFVRSFAMTAVFILTAVFASESFCDAAVLDNSILLKSNHSIGIQETYNICRDIKSYNKNMNLKFKVSDKSVVRVNEKGILRALKTGSATVKITVGNKTDAKMHFRIYKAPKKISFKSSTYTVKENMKTKLRYSFGKNTFAKKVTFKSSNPKIAVVSKSGVVKGIKKGKCHIRITAYNGVFARCKIQVSDIPDGVRSNLDPNKKMIALTYDDGPNYSVTKKILNTLKKYDSRATFFIVGNRISYSGNESLLKQMKKQGNELGNHTYTHNYYGANVPKSEFAKTRKAIYNATGTYPTLCRPTGGEVANVYKKYADAPLIIWSIDTEDWRTRNADSTYKAVMKNASDGDIVLMHDLQTSTGKATEKIVPALIKKGYQIVTVSELAYYKGHKKLEKGSVYYSFK
ncbi:MAG: polysaccharide deacetylase family protein [Acutalibacteraceae bacterium]